jgi:hypothetical protein
MIVRRASAEDFGPIELVQDVLRTDFNPENRPLSWDFVLWSRLGSNQ